MKDKLNVEEWIKYMQESPVQLVDSKEDYWKNKTQWIDSEHRLKLNLLSDYRLSDEEYRKTRSEIRELMELNMVMYGKW